MPRGVLPLPAIIVALLALSGSLHAQSNLPPIAGDRLSGFVLPIEPVAGDIEINALRAATWTVDDTQRLVLEGDVLISIAGQRFAAGEAEVWINRLPSAEGLINQIAVYFDRLTDPARAAGSGVAGGDVLVTGSARGEVRLNVAVLSEGQPPATSLRLRGEARLAEHLRGLLTREQRLRRMADVDVPPSEPERALPVPGGAVRPPEPPPPGPRLLPVPPVAQPWLAVPQGRIHFAAREIEVVTGEVENVITLIGPLVIEQMPAQGQVGVGTSSRLTLSAQRGVIFTDPMPLADMVGTQLDAETVRGIYLEGNVIIRAGGDAYIVRSPRVYYDYRTDQALLLDAVLRTHSRAQQTLVYARAEEMRQVAAEQWTAERMLVSTSEFHRPHLAVGARRIAVTQTPSEETAVGERETHLDARHVTLRVGNVPIFYLPRYSGTIGDTALRGVRLGSRDTDGLQFRTAWNVYSLLGLEAPDGLEATLQLDAFTKRGAGAGLLFRYDPAALPGGWGEIDLYGLYDRGEDKTSTGLKVDPDRDWRGVALWAHHHKLHPDWTLQAQAAHISDPSFITTWRESDFMTRREYETSVYLKGQRDHTAITLLAKYELNDFISNDYLLASRQYQVDKLPELTYRRYGDALGPLTYSTESRLGRMRLVLNETTPREIGVVPGAFATAAGFGFDSPIDQLLLARGLRTSIVGRADTRHELAMPFDWGIFRIVPFGVGRATAYSRDFKEFSSDADDLRLHLSGGVNVSTQFQRIDNTVNSRFFDLHRLRHIVEPRLLLWYGWSDVPRYALPSYDPAVEDIGEGAAVQAGVRNVWQTQRGGPGRWRSVDFLTIDTALVLTGGDADRRSPVPQFFEYRPEYSQLGDHVFASLLWLPSDSLTIGGQLTFDLDDRSLARGSIGFGIEHSPVLTTFVEYRSIRPSNVQLLDVAWIYRISPKYRVSLHPQWDFVAEQLRAINVQVTRRFPEFDLIMRLAYDRIREETTFAATIGFVRF